MRYPKIDTLFTRGEDFYVTDQIRRPEFLTVNKWLVSEKVDGMNIRVSLEPETIVDTHKGTREDTWKVVVRGKTSKADIPPHLLNFLHDKITVEKMKALWLPSKDPETGEEIPQEYPITLFGEGYGQKIQKGGGAYFPSDLSKEEAVGFIVFDVLVGDESWLEWENVKDICKKLDIPHVPYVTMNIDQLDDFIYMVKCKTHSDVAQLNGGKRPIEGIVAKSIPQLFNARGERVMWKLKSRDFKENC